MIKKYLLIIFIIVLLFFVSYFIFVNKNFVNQYIENSNNNNIKNQIQTISNINHPKIVELQNGDSYDLNIDFVNHNINGKTYRMLAYNGSIPGPIIKVKQGSEITLKVKNNTNFSTLLHSHGVRLENQFDGTHLVQKEINPGETFAYKIKFPDFGFYWYHPHLREDLQQELGLYGGFLVIPSNNDYWLKINKEEFLFLDDILIENNNLVLNYENADHTLMGKFGNIMLTNGQTYYSLKVNKGEVIRFYIVNTANVRPFNFSIENTKLKLIGSDNGLYEKARWVDSVLIAPSERYIVEALFDKEGKFKIQNKTPNKSYDLGEIIVESSFTDISYANFFNKFTDYEKTTKDIVNLKQYLAKKPDKEIWLAMNMGMMMNNESMGMMMTMMNNNMNHNNHNNSMMQAADNIEWEDRNPSMNKISNIKNIQWKIIDKENGLENMDIQWKFKKGDLVKIRIFNDPNSMHSMQHPIHIHGQRFLVLARNGVQENNFAWKDTVLVKTGETVDILVDFSNQGKWLIHCHIPEHMEAGMMMQFEVE
ncbi:MAG: oxidoreductase [Candidatus Parcubacteria bacterium]|nr:MAG: oxidoreductase [Candidatus Parcubacteria bacterium]